MTLVQILEQIRAWVRPRKERYEYKTYGRTRVWDQHGRELHPSDPEFIKIEAQMREQLKASMREIP